MALWFYCSQTLLNYFGFERTRLFQKRVVRTKYDIYVLFLPKNNLNHFFAAKFFLIEHSFLILKLTILYTDISNVGH